MGSFPFIDSLRLATLIGSLSVLVALLLAIFAVYAKFTPVDQLPQFMQEIPLGFTALMVAISFCWSSTNVFGSGRGICRPRI